MSSQRILPSFPIVLAKELIRGAEEENCNVRETVDMSNASWFKESRVVMKKSFCELLQQYYPEPSEAEDFYSTFIANCVFNSFLSYIAIMLNVLTIHAIRKTSSLPKTLKILLLGVLPFLMLVLVY